MTPFTTVLADPAWRYDDKLRQGKTKRSAQDVYRTTMTTDEICRLATGVRHIAGFETADDAFLWLWVTNPFLLNGDGVRVCKEWGFEPKQLITWVKGQVYVGKTNLGDVGEDETCGPMLKLHFGMGRYTRGCTEHLILATRGKAASLVLSHSERNLILALAGRHSEKPAEAYTLIERVSPGPYLELFARQRREGWTSWGDELPAEAA